MEHKPYTREPLSLILTIIPLGGQSLFSSFFQREKQTLRDYVPRANSLRWEVRSWDSNSTSSKACAFAYHGV